MISDLDTTSRLSKEARWDNRFMELSDFVSNWSEERGRKVGAVIVGTQNTIVSMGYNGMPRGISAQPEDRHDKQNSEKYYWFEHAERNAIYNAARIGIALEGTKIYSSLFPCADCARAIIQSGIVELVTRKPPEFEENFARSMNVSLELLTEASILVRFYNTD